MSSLFTQATSPHLADQLVPPIDDVGSEDVSALVRILCINKEDRGSKSYNDAELCR